MKRLLNHPVAGIYICILLMCVSCFFVYFGIQVLIFAYTLKEPVPFILTFFSSNLIILISLALLAGFSFRIAHWIKMKKVKVETANPDADGK
jgi:hypothetical protein